MNNYGITMQFSLDSPVSVCGLANLPPQPPLCPQTDFFYSRNIHTKLVYTSTIRQHNSQLSNTIFFTKNLLNKS